MVVQMRACRFIWGLRMMSDHLRMDRGGLHAPRERDMQDRERAESFEKTWTVGDAFSLEVYRLPLSFKMRGWGSV